WGTETGGANPLLPASAPDGKPEIRRGVEPGPVAGSAAEHGDAPGHVEVEAVREDVAEAEGEAAPGDGHAAVRAADGDRGEPAAGHVEGVEVRVRRRLE